MTIEQLLDGIKENSYVTKRWESGNVIIKVVSVFKEDLDTLIDRFINPSTFPYVNTCYNRILATGFDGLSYSEKVEVKGIIQKYIAEIDNKQRETFLRKTDSELKDEFGFDDVDLLEDKENLFEDIKAGYYCEMLLYNILLSIGCAKVISKLYFQFGEASPTGVDVPFLDLERGTLVLGECKLYKDIKAGIRSCYKDLKKIVIDGKKEKEFAEWFAKYKSINEEVQNWMENRNITDPQALTAYVEKYVCLGFVIGANIDECALQKYLLSRQDIPHDEKTEIILIALPIESKTEFVEKCYHALVAMGGTLL